ncbi:hypothetical protein JCM3774_000243 [Rhodotorula dairenensis]
MALPIHTGEGKPRNRRPTPLRLGSSSNRTVSPQLAVHPDPSVARSPHSPIFYSPTLEISPASAVSSASSSHFSQLPPSPPLAGGEWKRSPDFVQATAAYPTPPGSDSGRNRARSPGDDTRLDMSATVAPTASMPMPRQNSHSSSILLGEDLAHPKSPNKRRPSLILTSAETDEPQGLAIGIDMGDDTMPMPSPLMRRSFSAGSTSPINSPVSSYFSTSPANTPPLGSMPSPLLSADSPVFGGSVAMGRSESSSPRLPSIAGFANGLVRRASSSALKTDLPTAIKSPLLPPSPTLPGPPKSPILAAFSGLAPSRGGASFASAARDKEREKEKELRERELQKRKAGYHNRMFSWAARPDDPLVAKKAQAVKLSRVGKGQALPAAKRASWTRRLIILGTLAAISYLCFRPGGYLSRSKSTAPVLSAPPRYSSSKVPSAQHRNIGGNAPPAHQPAPVPPPPAQQQQKQPMPERREVEEKEHPHAAAFNARDARKPHNVFVAEPQVEFVDHHAEVPPITHSDAQERDTLVLYRILGNDLPPRHAPGQTLRNLRFLLEHESDFSILPPLGPHGVHHAHMYGSGSQAKLAHSQDSGLRVEKYYILNRIAEPEHLGAIIGLLRLYSVPDSHILTIPFDWNEYQRRDFRWDGGVDNAHGWDLGDGRPPHAKGSQWTKGDSHVQIPSDLAKLLEEADGDEARGESHESTIEKLRRSDMLGRLRALDFIYHEKNLYAMNNNGGRNFALQHGRSLPHARWILPLDGNSFFTPAAMFSIVRTLSIAGEGPAASRYLVIPMARLLDNDAVLANNSISMVPLGLEEGASAIVDAEILHRPAIAPETPEEPQIGFRYDSTESFQEAMRYGRRSKLELLWRLGAIPYARGLDKRTLPWEVIDRAHITIDSWGSIPGIEGAATRDSVIHAPHGEVDNWREPNPEHGPLAYVKGGWVYRLFSGSRNQEEHSPDAATLRNMNRIRGIVAFLEHLDEQVARGDHGCFGEENPFHCGFNADRLWNFDMFDIERLRQKYRLQRRDAVLKIEAFERQIQPTLHNFLHTLADPISFEDLHAQKAATATTLLALAGYLTGNATYSNTAASVISQRFIRRVPLYYRNLDASMQTNAVSLDEHVDDLSDMDPSVRGYAFPPFPREDSEIHTWSAELAAKVAMPGAPPLPFDPATFDPILFLDAVRILNHASGPQLETPAIVSYMAVLPLLNSHLSYLLFSEEAIEFSRHPPSALAGAHYDAKVAALAAFLDDAQLVGRVANRARLRLPHRYRAEGLLDPAREVRDIHYRLLHGLTNTRLRPYNMVADALEDDGVPSESYVALAHGNNTPFTVLGL